MMADKSWSSHQIFIPWNHAFRPNCSTTEHFGSSLVQLNRNLSGIDFRFNWTEVEPEKFHSSTIWPDCMISSLARNSTINYNVALILKNSQQFSVQLGSIEPKFIWNWLSVQLNRSWTRKVPQYYYLAWLHDFKLNEDFYKKLQCRPKFVHLAANFGSRSI